MTDPLTTLHAADTAAREARRLVRQCPVNDDALFLARRAEHARLHADYCRLVESRPDDVLLAYDSPLARAVLMRRGSL